MTGIDYSVSQDRAKTHLKKKGKHASVRESKNKIQQLKNIFRMFIQKYCTCCKTITVEQKSRRPQTDQQQACECVKEWKYLIN